MTLHLQCGVFSRVCVIVLRRRLSTDSLSLQERVRVRDGWGYHTSPFTSASLLGERESRTEELLR
jgi:hypothetical protein